MRKAVQTAHVIEGTKSVHVGSGPASTGVKTITFHDDDKIIGEVSWATGAFQFTGDTDSSADVFFNQVLKGLCDQYIERYKTIDLELKALLLHCTQVLGDKHPNLTKQIKDYFI